MRPTKKHRPHLYGVQSMLIKCNWLPFYRPYSFASRVFTRFAEHICDITQNILRFFFFISQYAQTNFGKFYKKSGGKSHKKKQSAIKTSPSPAGQLPYEGERSEMTERFVTMGACGRMRARVSPRLDNPRENVYNKNTEGAARKRLAPYRTAYQKRLTVSTL